MYNKNNSLNFLDPLGLQSLKDFEVSASDFPPWPDEYIFWEQYQTVSTSATSISGTYNLDSQVLIITDKDKYKTIVLCAISGGAPFGDPIPEGKYEILERAGRAEFYRLDAIDSQPRNDTHEPTGRTKFRLHKPGRTIGCIAASKDCRMCWENVIKLINSAKTIDVDVASHRRFEFIRGPAKERIKKYGELQVMRSGAADDEIKKKCKCNCTSDQ